MIEFCLHSLALGSLASELQRGDLKNEVFRLIHLQFEALVNENSKIEIPKPVEIDEYSSVVFGWGAIFEGNWVHFESIFKKCVFSEVNYFGDIDVKGLMIPSNIKSRFEDKFDISFNLDPFWYEKLLSLQVMPGLDESHTGNYDFKKIAPIIPDKIHLLSAHLLEIRRSIPGSRSRSRTPHSASQTVLSP